MKINAFTLRFVAIALLYVTVIIPAAVLHAQSSHGEMSVVMGDYVLKGFGEVSTPEQGNQFHRLNAEAFVSVNKKQTIFLGGYAQDWSRFNTSVLSTAALVKGRLQTNRYMMEASAGPVLQRRYQTAVGGAFVFKGTYHAGQNSSFFAGGDFEVGRMGIFTDIYLGTRVHMFELRVGEASYIGGEYAQLSYFASKNFSFGLTYASDRAVNKMLETQGFGDFHRRALGIQAKVTF